MKCVTEPKIFIFFWYAKIFTQASNIWFRRFLHILGCSGQYCDVCLPRGCPEVAQRLPRGCPEAAQRLPKGCPEAARRLPGGHLKAAQKSPKQRQKRKWIDLWSVIHSYLTGLRFERKQIQVPLVWQIFSEVGQNDSWKCKVLLLCNTKASRKVIMSWCLQYDLISASMFHHSIFSRQVLTWFLQGILILLEKALRFFLSSNSPQDRRN